MNKAMLLVGIIMLAMFTFGVINIASSYQTGNELDYYLLKDINNFTYGFNGGDFKI